VAGVGAVGLGALLVAAPRARFGRLGQVHDGADRAQFFDRESPAGRRLERGLDPQAVKAPQEPSHALAVRGRDPRSADLAGGRVDPLGRDLRPVLIEPHHDRARTLRARGVEHRARCRLRTPHVGHDASHTVGHVGRYLLFAWPAARPQSARAFTMPFDVEDRPPSASRPILHLGRERRPAHAIFRVEGAAPR
jgi:hypothetical protein